MELSEDSSGASNDDNDWKVMKSVTKLFWATVQAIKVINFKMMHITVNVVTDS